MQAGLALGKNKGYFGSDYAKLLSYHPAKAWLCFGPCVARRLTAFDTYHKYTPHVVLVVYNFALMIFLAHVAFPDTDMGKGPACAPKMNVKICGLEATMAEAKGEFRFLIAFLLSGYVSTTLVMWRTRRTNYAALCGNVRNLTIQLASFLPCNKGDEKIMETRRTLGRWVILAYELAMLKSRGAMDSEDAFRWLSQDMDLLAPNEWEAMVPGDRHSTVFCWIQTALCQLQQAGTMPKEFVVKTSYDISSIRAQANDLMSSLDRDIPYSYTSLVCILVNINLFIMTTWKAIEWSTWCRSLGFDQLLQQPKWWLDMLVMIFWNLSYRAMYDLGSHLYHPFGNRPIDVAHETISAGLQKLSKSLMDGAAIPPVNFANVKPKEMEV